MVRKLFPIKGWFH